ncbi:zinc-binding dehydrogenase [Dictyobacter formicarum]|uniref:IMP dehydrogenase n=1 Tax=Dictyobacter formicarum TaxID=2778368 RepID=A0ABQ3VPI0_9CHLR|nr:zinc-binding dehydrogenase [Dictyobacter formicarum]GHO87001.1 IMP dehydrogenase [Dictyobacter formicarum]
MQAAIFRGAFDIQVEQISDAAILEPTDAVVQITHACICGTDLWPYRGQGPYQPGWQIGHEWMGLVMDVGSQVRTIKRGDRVIASFDFCDGTCEFCQKGLDSACVQGGIWGFGHEGGQAEAIRARFADATLIVIPPSVEGDEAMLKAILPLTDVMATGHHAAVTAGVRPGGSVVVIGDGAVGLCAILAARRLGAERILALGHQPHRFTLARQFGATEVITSRGEQAIGPVLEMTQGGAEAVLECVGTEETIKMAVNMSRPGGTVGFVGAPHGSGQIPLGRMFSSNIGVRGGLAPARAYLPELLKDVLAGQLDPSPILDRTVSLAEVASGYRAMDQRQAIKVLVQP